MISETICTVTSENSKTSLSDNRRLKTCDTVEFFQRGSQLPMEPKVGPWRVSMECILGCVYLAFLTAIALLLPFAEPAPLPVAQTVSQPHNLFSSSSSFSFFFRSSFFFFFFLLFFHDVNPVQARPPLLHLAKGLGK